MSNRLFVSEAKFLERPRIALTTARPHEEIRTLLADFGMDEAKLAEGWGVYEHAKRMKELSDRETEESTLASMDYQEAFDEFQATFKRHRGIGGIFFKDAPEVLVSLGVKGESPSKTRSSQQIKGLLPGASR